MWSPEWLAITQRIHVRRRATFDSSATPKAGTRRIVPTEWARVDVGEIQHHLTTHDHAPAESATRSVTRLSARVAELEHQLAAARNRPAETIRVEVPVLTEPDLERLREVVATLADLSRDLTATADRLATALTRAAITSRPHSPTPSGDAAPTAATSRIPDAAAGNAAPGSSPIPLGKAEREILTVLVLQG